MPTLTSAADTQQGRRRRLGSWTLRIVLALAFAASGLFKLSGRPAAIDEFARVGLGQWLRYLTALMEVGGAVLLVWPRTIALGAAVLGATCVGAFFAQLFRLHIDVIHVIVLGAILAAILWAHRDQFGFRRRGAAFSPSQART